jgi:hypothetical protein
MMTSVRPSPAEDFYETRLRDGQASYGSRNYADAAEQLRIAAFGFLDRPQLLSEALVYTVLTQTAEGKSTEADVTLARFLDVERRFAPYERVTLSPEARAEFQALLLRRVSLPSLQGMPGLAPVVAAEEQKLANLPAAERWKVLEASSRKEPSTSYWALRLAQEAEQKPDPAAVIQWSSRALTLDPTLAQARALRAGAYTARGECALALADIAVLSATELAARPATLGDRFVCLVALKEWGRAEEASQTLPSTVKTRTDVVSAQGKLVASRPKS